MQPYLIELFWSEEEQAYLCTAPDLSGCSAAGDTPLEAIREMQDAMDSWLQACSSMGRQLPMPLARPKKAAWLGKKELHQIPDGKLAEILELVHYSRIGVQMEQRGGVNIEPLPRATDEQLLDELRAFIRLPNTAPLGEFRLTLEGYRFDREEANER